MTAIMSPVTLLESEDAIAQAARTILSARQLPIDVESNGLHAYRARLCTLQIGVVQGSDDLVDPVLVVDPIVAGDHALAPLATALGPAGPRKIVHDLAFDARMLARHDLTLGNVFDTALAARFLGVMATSLAALAESRLGVVLEKTLQHHDWGARPLTQELRPYLAADVAHLPALARSLEDELQKRDIVEEVDAETLYRLSTALASRDDEDPRPAYARIKGAQDLEPRSLSVLRRVADVREMIARRQDRPTFKVMGNETLLEIARSRPKNVPELGRIRGFPRQLGAVVADLFLAAVEQGASEGDIPEEERRLYLTPPQKPPREVLEARRGREQRLTGWRRTEAKRREVDEQVILPGHCLQEIANGAPASMEALRAVGGIAECRLARYGADILRLVAGA